MAGSVPAAAGVDGRVALIVGGGSGIGRATATAFADCGASVVVFDVDAAGADATVATIDAAGGVASAVVGDVRDDAAVARAVSEAVRRYGRLDCAFNNAGVEQRRWARVADCDEAEWDLLLEVNVKGVWRCLRHEIPVMVAAGRGAIVNAASVAGLVATPDDPAYGATKAAVVSLTRSAARGYAGDGLRVNAVCPGHIASPMMDRVLARDRSVEAAWLAAAPFGRFGDPAEVAAAVVWLCSDAASFVTGHALVVDGGLVL